MEIRDSATAAKKKTIDRRKELAACVASFFAIALPAYTVAANVTNCAESGAGSLRAAIASAKSGSTIDLTGIKCVITLTTGEIEVKQASLSLMSGSPSQVIVDGGYSAHHINRVFHHTGNGSFEISGLTVTDGTYVTLNNASAEGGCIASNGSVVVYNSVVSNCFVQAMNGYIAAGAGLNVAGDLELVNSKVTGNFADAGSITGGAYGAGIYCNGNLKIKYSTIANNTAFGGNGGSGGGIRVGHGNVYVLGSTISNNTAGSYAGLQISHKGVSTTALILNTTISSNTTQGAKAAFGTVVDTTLANSTVAFNTSAAPANSAGVSVVNAALDLQSSIIAMNTSANALSDLDTTAASSVAGANNLITQLSGFAPGAVSSACPKISRLSDHGGTTLTHGLLLGSPALDNGNNKTGINGKALISDQRGAGYSRTVGAATDIGALEFNGTPDDQIFSSRFENRCN